MKIHCFFNEHSMFLYTSGQVKTMNFHWFVKFIRQWKFIVCPVYLRRHSPCEGSSPLPAPLVYCFITTNIHSKTLNFHWCYQNTEKPLSVSCSIWSPSWPDTYIFFITSKRGRKGNSNLSRENAEDSRPGIEPTRGERTS